MNERSIRDFHGDDVWRDDEGTIWVRQSQLVELAQFHLDRAAADRATLERVREWCTLWPEWAVPGLRAIVRDEQEGGNQ